MAWKTARDACTAAIEPAIYEAGPAGVKANTKGTAESKATLPA